MKRRNDITRKAMLPIIGRELSLIQAVQPATVRADLAPVADHTGTIQVWSYTLTEQVSRVALDTCKVTSAWARPDQGWPYASSVYIHTTARNYLFTFLTPDASSLLVKQVLDSVALS